jgi:predicted RNase H-like HicB family nuclease
MAVEGFELDQFYSLDGACALVPCDLPGCAGLGDSFQAAMAAITAAVPQHLELHRQQGVPVPEPRTLSRYYSPNVEDDYRRRFPPLSLADLLGLVQEGGWSPSGSDGSCRHYLHPTRSGVLTIAGKLGGTVPALAEMSLLRVAGVERQPARRRWFGR